MGCSKPVGSPTDESALPNSAASELLDADENTMYYNLIGILMYIATQTRSSLLVVTGMRVSYQHEQTS